MSSLPLPVEPSSGLRWSRFAQRLLAARPPFAEEVDAARAAGWTAADMRAFLAAREALDPAALGAALRELRARVMLRTAARDLAGLAPLAEVTGAMSDLAEVALAAALAAHRTRMDAEHGAPTGGPGAQDLLVVGMGKLGGRELNVSSDIDLVFVYPDEGETAHGLSNHEFFVKLGQRVIRTLADVTPDGQVFRVDMRLRPWGDAGPLAASFDALEQYFVAQGREWERYAWIKARVVAGGDERMRAELAKIAQPFVFRKYLDFGTIDAVRKLHAQIRQEVARRDLAGDVKLGPGGIREIEFIAQGFQLIRGGRDPGLRARATLEVLAALGARRQLAEPAVAELSAAYVFLRRLEHRLQYLDDAQTHALPESPDDRQLVAESMGAPDWTAFARELDGHRAAVTRHFDSVFAAADETNASAPVWQGTLEGDAAERDLAARGYVEPRETLARIRALRTSARYQQLPESSRDRLDLLVPRFIEACAQGQSAAAPGERVAPDVALRRTLDFVEAISRRASYLALLAEQPSALAKVAGILAASSWAAEYLTRHPILLDELLDARVLGEAPDWSEFATTLRREMAAHDGDVERQMDAMREIHHAWVFRLLMQDLAGLLTVERLGDHLSLAADLVLAVTIEVCWRLVRARHTEIPRFAVIGYGKLGGKELGYASDLDIVFVYDDPHEAAAENYARLAQRMNSWLSSRTPAGTLFETDLALRPSGGAGLLVSSMSAFKRYQLESAWLWEHQALTRARFCAGDAAIGAVFDALRRDLLQASRDPAQLGAEVLTMRQKMLDAHPNRSDLFDLKHDRGGMVDIEFIVQHLVLAHSREHYELTGNLGNIALLHMAGALGLVPAGLAQHVADAYRDYRRLQHRLRLNGAEFARVERASVAVHVEATLGLWQAVFGSTG
ncbi:MAG TPA: bifunctional [glutamate--ammonia ligase]-adenylyl-L-tyrosine phosphorylase/[glutamate--ammonia-ligase] adenylyltransferase [Burkholderiales bacterium]|nr:bifunctional [glutamate--ammonia ligase]-adenylyl-L-tyrosine phosphorylase/[glutamate--ammonia-ligase] adenylyltransferase [Burkholderiales bacterium]